MDYIGYLGSNGQHSQILPFRVTFIVVTRYKSLKTQFISGAESPTIPGAIRVRNPIGGQKARFTFLTKERLRLRGCRRWECRLNVINVGRGRGRQ